MIEHPMVGLTPGRVGEDRIGAAVERSVTGRGMGSGRATGEAGARLQSEIFNLKS